jgi:formate dehydrogenase subunit gamma
MEASHVVHGIAALIFIAISFGHIYLGTLGMEGSLESMTTGYVDANWAKAHHDLWYEEMQAKPAGETRQEALAGGVAASAKASPVSEG